jgi:hypothetical protein
MQEADLVLPSDAFRRELVRQTSDPRHFPVDQENAWSKNVVG